jgi:glycolate oxidase
MPVGRGWPKRAPHSSELPKVTYVAVSDPRLDELDAELGAGALFVDGAINPDWLHDESLHPRHENPLAVVAPRSQRELAMVARWASRHRISLTPRGSGTGLSGAVAATRDGIIVSFHQLRQIVAIDLENHSARVEAGVTLRELNEALDGSGLYYPVHPGELSGSLGGNVNTNAGGMRAVRYGVTRHHILGLTVITANGDILELGGPVTKSSSGYDLTQLIIGSEGTLALVAEVEVRLSPRPQFVDTLLIPFARLTDLAQCVSPLIASGLQPAVVEYLDPLTMASVTARANLHFGVSDDIAAQAQAYLVVVLETRTRQHADLDLAAVAEIVNAAGALDVYVLNSGAGHQLIAAREEAFWVAKAAGSNDIVDIVVPRAAVTTFLTRIHEPAFADGSFIAGCGHIGDGNVHLSIFEADDTKRHHLLQRLFALAVELKGHVSGEHGLGRDKLSYWLDLSDPRVVSLQHAVARVFDPLALLNSELSKERS